MVQKIIRKIAQTLHFNNFPKIEGWHKNLTDKNLEMSGTFSKYPKFI